MRNVVFLAALTLAAGLASAAPAMQPPIGTQAARHLLNRTGFEARADQIDAYAKLSRDEAVDRLLSGATTVARTPAPSWSGEFDSPRRLRQLTGEERKAYQRRLVERSVELKGWWVTEMLATGSPLTERMTLFWHNHFPSSLQKVRSTALLYRQNVLLRQHALGNFGDLLHAVSKDPAMLVYLDSASSNRGQPNENFAREVMELFTLGEGGYGEQDIREAARAFTGWSIDLETGAYQWRPFAHDGGMKTVLGRRGEFAGDEVLDILLAQPRTAEFVVAKLWKEFISPVPDPSEVARIARVFRDSKYDIKSVLRALLASDAFYALENRGVLFKSPVDLVIGTLRQFDVGYSDPLPFTLLLRALGQDLFSPPNVKGWPGGEAWINSSTLLARRQFLERLIRVDESRIDAPMAGEMQAVNVNPAGAEVRARARRAALDIRFSGAGWLDRFGGDEDESAVQRVLLALPAVADDSARSRGVDLIRRVTSDPAYQLK